MARHTHRRPDEPEEYKVFRELGARRAGGELNDAADQIEASLMETKDEIVAWLRHQSQELWLEGQGIYEEKEQDNG